ncbi:MAG: hypothetical protein KA408_05565 [Flavobacteriales bacterium]|nr:hypothetical protein [Flavobacteriales bacterium]
MKTWILAFTLLTVITCGDSRMTDEENGNNKLGSVIMQEPEFNISEYEKRKESGTTHFFLDDGTEIQQFDVEEGDVLNYVEYRTVPGQYFKEYRLYYENGNIKTSGKEYPRQFQAGVWSEFDRSGKLDREIDHDLPYKFTFDSLLMLIQGQTNGKDELAIDVFSGTTMISRKVSEQGPRWYVKWKEREERRERLVIDGETGQVLERGTVEWEEN